MKLEFFKLKFYRSRSKEGRKRRIEEQRTKFKRKEEHIRKEEEEEPNLEGKKRRRIEDQIWKEEEEEEQMNVKNGGTRVPRRFFFYVRLPSFVTRVPSLNSSFRHSRYQFAKQF